MAWAALGKVAVGAVKGKAKQVATDKLLNRKKKTDTRRPSAKKMMGGDEGGGEKGGALAVRPTTQLVPSAGGSIQKIEKTEETGSKGNTLLVIKTKLVSIDTILKGTLAAEKKAEDVKRKAQERSERKEDEKELEDDSKEGKKAQKFKLAPPKQVLSFWEKIKSFFGKVLFGWLAVRLIDWLPKLMPIVKFLAAAADFIIKVGGFLLNGLVTFIDWGYKVVEATRGFVKKVFGEKGAKAFDGVTGTLTKVFNIIGAIALASLALGNEANKQQKGPKGKKPKWQKQLQQKWKKSRLGKKVRNLKAGFKKTTRKISQAVKPKNIVKNLKNLKNTRLGQSVSNIAKKADPRKWKMPKVKTPGWMKSAGAAIKKNMAGAGAWIKSLPAKTRQMWDDVAKKVGPYIDEMGQGIANAGKSIGAKWTEVTEKMKPQKIIDDLMAKVRPAIDDILKKNPIIGKLLSKLSPKNARKSIQGLLTKAANNPALKKLIKTLKANKGASKGLGPVDKIITALTALADYALFKESPINAILKGLGGLLGYGVGFSAASAVPVLGQSGIFNFAGGMAGGIAGEWLAMKIAKGLAGTPLGEIDDPIMGPKDVEAGLPARKLVRDPDGLLDHMIKGAGGEPIVKDNVEGGKTKEKISKTLKIGKKEYDLSKSMGGLSQEDYNALSNKDRGILDRRMRMYASQNTGNANNIVSTNGVSNKVSSVSDYASYEDDVEVVDGQEAYDKGFSDASSGSEQSELEKADSVPLVVGGGSGGSDEISARLYERG